MIESFNLPLYLGIIRKTIKTVTLSLLKDDSLYYYILIYLRCRGLPARGTHVSAFS